ncbi:MAG: hypothetical protein Q9209_005296 [Squamulea sp. 1 TL-2023]
MLHFNTLTTSRVEGGHRVLKHILKFSTGDLMTVVGIIELLLKIQHENYTTKLDQKKMKIASNWPREAMRKLVGHISSYALQKIRKQWKFVTKAQSEAISLVILQGPSSRIDPPLPSSNSDEDDNIGNLLNVIEPLVVKPRVRPNNS